MLAAACGRHEVLPDEVEIVQGTGVPYVWQEGDSWRFIAWAVLDTEQGEGWEALALTCGFMPDAEPGAGATIVLPLDRALAGALENRLAAARLVRDATALHEAGDDESAIGLLQQSISTDSAWSVPRYDLALIHSAAGRRAEARALLLPLAEKPRPAVLLASMAWDEGDTAEAQRLLEMAMLAETPSCDAIASAALLYTVTGDTYLASRLWLRLLSNAGADSRLRLMAVEYCLMLESRHQQ
jgi:tetratricopeptide (TPR) repeat protein